MREVFTNHNGVDGLHGDSRSRRSRCSTPQEGLLASDTTLDLTATPPAVTVEIFVKDLQGNLTIDAALSDTVAIVKAKIEEKTGVLVDQWLGFKGRCSTTRARSATTASARSDAHISAGAAATRSSSRCIASPRAGA